AVPSNYPIYIAGSYGDAFRAQRITDMLNAGTNYTADDFIRMQNDVKEQDADLMLPRMLAAAPSTDAGRQALERLKGWDRMMQRDRPEPLIYSAWASLLKRTL